MTCIPYTLVSLSQNCYGKVSLTVHHLRTKGITRQYSSADYDSAPSDYNTSPTKRGTIKSVLMYMYLCYCCLLGAHIPPLYRSPSPSQRLPRPHDPPPYLSPADSTKSRSEHRGTTPLRSDTSFEEDEGYSPLRHQPHSNPQQYRDVVGQSLPDTRHHLYTGRGDVPLVGPRNKELRSK